jgi:hypothetical protein
VVQAAGTSGAVDARAADEAAATASWEGGPSVAAALLDCLALELATAAEQAAPRPLGSLGSPAGGNAGARGPAPAHSVQPGPGGAGSVARAALEVLASLREWRRHGILAHLIQEREDQGPLGSLPMRLVRLADECTSDSGRDGGQLTLLIPAPRPADVASLMAWWQRLRVAQEALVLLRGLGIDSALGAHRDSACRHLEGPFSRGGACPGLASCLPRTIEPRRRVAAPQSELLIPPAASSGAGASVTGALAASGRCGHLTLVLLSRVEQLDREVAAPAQPGLPPPPLAPWAAALGVSSAAQGAGVSARSAPATASTHALAYVARSLRSRVLRQMDQNTMQD